MDPPPAAGQAPGTRFPRHSRLLKAGEFRAILRRPLTASDPLFRVCARRATGGSRLGVTVSRKCAARAVDRNRIKRHVREAFRRLRPELDAGPGIEVIVIARPEARLAGAAELRQAVDGLLRRITQRMSNKTDTV